MRLVPILILILVSACRQAGGETVVKQKAPASPEDCRSVTPTAKMELFSAEIPSGTRPSEMLVALERFLVLSDTPIVTRDRDALTLATAPFTGQTIRTDCDINEYRDLSLQVAIAGTHVFIAMSCRGAFGWESTTSIPAGRGNESECLTVSEGDAKIPAMIFQGAVALIDQARVH